VSNTYLTLNAVPLVAAKIGASDQIDAYRKDFPWNAPYVGMMA
jgi:hypothetical protein